MIGRTVHTTNIASSHHQQPVHSSTVLRDRLLRERTSSFVATATRHTRDVLRYERGGNRSNTIVRTLPGRVDRRVIHESRASFATISSPASPSPSRTVSRIALVSRRAAAKTSESTRIDLVREERVTAAHAHTLFRTQWQQMVSRRTQTVADSVTRTAHHSRTIRARTEELVWRRVMKTVADMPAEERRVQAQERSIVRTVRESTSVERSAAPPVMKLDPLVMDRLAEDVIRRVEQRIRIERERRGL